MQNERRIVYGCCFCAKEIDEPVAVAMLDHERGELIQQWWAHEECLKGAMHERVRDTFYSPAEEAT
jgi:hypothetical protein